MASSSRVLAQQVSSRFSLMMHQRAVAAGGLGAGAFGTASSEQNAPQQHEPEQGDKQSGQADAGEQTKESYFKKVVVVGGSGYVGRRVCSEAWSRGHSVTSVNARGKPSGLENEPWADKVTWHKADVFNTDSWKDVIDEDTVVVSAVGALGNAATMRRMIGDANVVACETAAAQGASKFVLISAATQNADVGFLRKIPLLDAYVDGKERAEQSVETHFGSEGKSYSLVRPGFIYGPKGGINLALIGVPMRMIFGTLMLNKLPFVGHVFFEPPVSVGEVGKAACACATRLDSTGEFNIVDTPKIRKLARALNHS